MDKEQFYSAVYEIVGQIPRGKIMTYGQIGFMIGSQYYARRVGRAMKDAPKHMDLPCHRVVNSKGRLAPSHVFGGEDRQRRILMDEGVVFTKSGYVDIKKSIRTHI